MGLASFAKKVGSPMVAVGSERHTQYMTGTGEFTGNYRGTGNASPTQANTGANKSVTNRSTGMQSKGGPQQQAASGNIGVVSQGMVNSEVQNDDVVLPYAKL